MKKLLYFLSRRVYVLFAILSFFSTYAFGDQPLRVMVIFAHPDEGEIYTGGVTALYTKMGAQVKFMSLTNGDAGHYSMKPADLAKRRYQEAMTSKKILGLADYEVLDYHDQHLENTKEARDKVIKSITEWNPDIVFTYYPAKGGHPDNMTAGYIVRDAAPELKFKKMPVFLYIRDFYTINFSYIPDVAVNIESVWDTKLAACTAQQSQVTEALPHQLGILEEVQKDKEKQKKLIYDNTFPFSKVTPDNLFALQKWYGPQTTATTFKYVEAFEIAEFGRQVNSEELKSLMPMVGK